MRHADALSRSVHRVQKDVNLSRDIIKEEQGKDNLCIQYKQYENFWTYEDGVLYYQEGKGRPRIVIPGALVSTVLTYYHELPFTAH